MCHQHPDSFQPTVIIRFLGFSAYLLGDRNQTPPLRKVAAGQTEDPPSKVHFKLKKTKVFPVSVKCFPRGSPPKRWQSFQRGQCHWAPTSRESAIQGGAPGVTYLRSISPSTQKVKMLEMVPPGQHPMMRTAIAWMGFREKLMARREAIRGMSPNWQSSPTVMPQGLLMCDHSFRISTEHPKENMSRPIITADATVKTSSRLPRACGPQAAPLNCWQGRLSCWNSSLPSPHLLKAVLQMNVCPDGWAGLPCHVLQQCNKVTRGESFQWLLASQVIHPNLINFFTAL